MFLHQVFDVEEKGRQLTWNDIFEAYFDIRAEVWDDFFEKRHNFF